MSRQEPEAGRKALGCVMLLLLVVTFARGGIDIGALIPSRETLINIVWGVCVIPPVLIVFVALIMPRRRGR